MYGIKKCAKFLKNLPIKCCSTNLEWGEAWRGDKPQISELKLRKKLGTESKEKHSSDNKNTRVPNVRPMKDESRRDTQQEDNWN
jgi:hypothetical protein